MKQQEEQSADIMIYQSIWKSLLLGVGSLILATGGLFIISDTTCNAITRIVGGWLSVIFFGIGGLFYTVNMLYMEIRQIPYLIIYADKLEYYIPLRRKRYTILFKDVELFRPIKVSHSEQVAIHYTEDFIQNKYTPAKTSRLKRSLLAFNRSIMDAPASIPTDNLSMKGEDICNILNKRVQLSAKS